MNEFFRYRLTYEKTGAARYIGHLDLQNVFQRAVRRAGIKPRYSEGFNPHVRLSFASPLAIGMDGFNELSDIDLAEELAVIDVVERLNMSFPDGLKAVECVRLDNTAKSAASLVRRASYEMTFAVDMKEAVNKYEAREFVYALEADGNVVRAVIACGGCGNLKPQVLAEELCEIAGVEFEPYFIEYKRMEMFF